MKRRYLEKKIYFVAILSLLLVRQPIGNSQEKQISSAAYLEKIPPLLREDVVTCAQQLPENLVPEKDFHKTIKEAAKFIFGCLLYLAVEQNANAESLLGKLKKNEEKPLRDLFVRLEKVSMDDGAAHQQVYKDWSKSNLAESHPQLSEYLRAIAKLMEYQKLFLNMSSGKSV